jgi:hypothetical protein
MKTLYVSDLNDMIRNYRAMLAAGADPSPARITLLSTCTAALRGIRDDILERGGLVGKGKAVLATVKLRVKVPGKSSLMRHGTGRGVGIPPLSLVPYRSLGFRSG